VTQDDVIEMAIQAGVDKWWDSGNEQREVLQKHLVAFAKLVAAKEREECADLLEFGYIDEENHHLQYAYEIRARGEQA
jgi:hypothetical protein